MKRPQIALVALCGIALIALWLLAMVWLASFGNPPHCDPHPGYRPDGQQCD